MRLEQLLKAMDDAEKAGAATSKLGGVDPPSSEQAAAGTWQEEMPEPMAEEQLAADPPQGPRPGSVQAQMGKSAMGAKPPPDLSRPLGYSPPKAPPRDVELEGLQADAKQKRGEAQFGQSVSDYTDRPTNFLDYAQKLGGGGASASMAKSGMWKGHAEEGDRAVDDLMARRKSEDGMLASQSAGASAAERKDPQSQTAKTYREALLKFAPDLAGQLEGASAEQMEKIAPWLQKYASENADLLQSKGMAEAKAVQEQKRDKERGEKLALDKEHYAQGQANEDRRNQRAIDQAAATRGVAATQHDDAKSLKLADKLDDDTAALAKASGSSVAMGRKALDEVDAAIAAGGGEAPGTGRLTAMLPDAVLTDKGNKTRQNALDALAIMLAERSGQSVSPEELKRNMGIYGINGSSPQFNEGMVRLRRDFEAALAAKQSGYGADVKKKFVEQGGTLATTPGDAPKGGMVKMKFPNGSTTEVPAADVEEAKRLYKGVEVP